MTLASDLIEFTSIVSRLFPEETELAWNREIRRIVKFHSDSPVNGAKWIGKRKVFEDVVDENTIQKITSELEAIQIEVMTVVNEGRTQTNNVRPVKVPKTEMEILPEEEMEVPLEEPFQIPPPLVCMKKKTSKENAIIWEIPTDEHYEPQSMTRTTIPENALESDIDDFFKITQEMQQKLVLGNSSEHVSTPGTDIPSIDFAPPTYPPPVVVKKEEIPDHVKQRNGKSLQLVPELETPFETNTLANVVSTVATLVVKGKQRTLPLSIMDSEIRVKVAHIRSQTEKHNVFFDMDKDRPIVFSTTDVKKKFYFVPGVSTKLYGKNSTIKTFLEFIGLTGEPSSFVVAEW